MRALGLGGACLASSLALATPDDGAPPVSFQREIAPILRARCQGCHQPALAEGDVILSSYAGMTTEEAGNLVVPGDPGASSLLEVLLPLGDFPPSMPEDGEPLSAAEVDLVRRWIAEGAPDDTPASLGRRPTPERPPAYRAPGLITSLDFSPDGTLLAVTGYHEVLLFAVDEEGSVAGEPDGRLVGLSERIESVAFSPDGTKLAVAGGSPGRLGELQVWDVAERLLELSVPVTFDTIYGASWSHDGTRIAFGCGDNTVRVVDAASGEELLYQGAHGDWVLDTVFSSDSTHLVSVGRDRSMKLIKVATQQFIDNITSITPGALKGGLMAVDRHPERDELLTAGADGTPRIYRMYREKKRVIGDDFNLIRALEPMKGRVFSACFSPDGQRVLAGSSHARAGTVRAYSAADGSTIWSRELPGAVYAVAVSPDGSRVAAGGFDGHVRLFGAEDGGTVGEFVPVPLEAAGTDSTAEPGERRVAEGGVEPAQASGRGKGDA
ncbi:MAG: c-type cytochrome domain-containing protein [Planctomycetota bacterium]|jgi:WD40 repeat protein|nr:c-type cytochrome domain-containing protein [Planctomycetota bacterium]MDP6763234.1 c-type cytochrome domain-containing protein [Planctomycetota bacterium]MDP6990557.1 c-type cytochrome domain-containing protein [Planctomycetota bacterium]